jgi:hypothetical protein
MRWRWRMMLIAEGFTTHQIVQLLVRSSYPYPKEGVLHVQTIICRRLALRPACGETEGFDCEDGWSKYIHARVLIAAGQGVALRPACGETEGFDCEDGWSVQS